MALLGREALEQLGPGQILGEGRSEDRPAPESAAGQFETRQASAPPSHAAPHVSEEPDVAAGTGVRGPDVPPGMWPAPQSVRRQPEVPKAEDSGETSPGAATRVEPPPVTVRPATEAPMTAAEQLRSEFEEARPATGPGQEVAPGADASVGEELERELAALRPLLTNTGPSTVAGTAPSVSEPAPPP